jgi:hypothetical protein
VNTQGTSCVQEWNVWTCATIVEPCQPFVLCVKMNVNFVMSRDRKPSHINPCVGHAYVKEYKKFKMYIFLLHVFALNNRTEGHAIYICLVNMGVIFIFTQLSNMINTCCFERTRARCNDLLLRVLNNICDKHTAH